MPLAPRAPGGALGRPRSWGASSGAGGPKALSHPSRRKRLEEAPLATRAFREAQTKEKLERYPKVPGPGGAPRPCPPPPVLPLGRSASRWALMGTQLRALLHTCRAGSCLVLECSPWHRRGRERGGAPGAAGGTPHPGLLTPRLVPAQVVLRVLFPDRYILQGFFRPGETGEQHTWAPCRLGCSGPWGCGGQASGLQGGGRFPVAVVPGAGGGLRACGACGGAQGTGTEGGGP